jgi:hypothetical protein
MAVDDDTADVGGVGAGNECFTVFGIPHICASVVLTTLRLGLLESHIFALSSGDSELVRELPIGGDDAGTAGADDCWAYAYILLQILKSITPARADNIANFELILLILKTDRRLLFI